MAEMVALVTASQIRLGSTAGPAGPDHVVLSALRSLEAPQVASRKWPASLDLAEAWHAAYVGIGHSRRNAMIEASHAPVRRRFIGSMISRTKGTGGM